MNININKVKIVVMVPRKNTQEVRDAICNAGAGTITGSNYSYCTSYVKSLGTFIPNNDANPYIGKANKLEIVKEDRLEVLCESNKVKNVISRLREVHPYEEPAIDIIPLLDEEYFE